MTDKPKLGRGNVVVTINDMEYTLKPSVHAVRTLSRKYGGLNVIVDRIVKLDFEAICDVVEAGLGKQIATLREKQELAEAIFETGFTDDTGKLGELCVRYVVSLMRGGRIMTPEEQEEALRELEEMQEQGKDTQGNLTSSSET